ncbi:PCNA-interacting partner-like [Lineus longissimus]|uniref:PCNA-interacting partner-like n=1 Tax=Lineus longissimus TaxID=88925 RepID=UPI00315CD52D
MSVFVLADACECEGENISRILDKLTKDGSPCKLLGDPRRFTHHRVTTLPGLFMTAYKQARLEKNERQILLSHEDHLIAIQLCLAEMNKQNIGDFDVEMSKVLEMSRKINKKKLTNVESEDLFDDIDEELSKLFDAYKEFLQSCNVYDMADLFRAVLDNSCLDVVESVFEGSNFILLQAPSTDLEKEMLQFVCRGKALVKLTCEEELNEGGDVNIMTEDVADVDDIIALLKKHGPSTSPISVTEGHVRGIFVSYLHLLVNSRNELSLARVINIPDRELDQQAFTDIKRVAKEKNMSMCQVALSYVMKIRLGGRSYAPDPNSPLGPHVKGLGDFTDLIHKLQMFAEEEPDVKTSISKVIRVIKNAIVKCKETLIKTDSVERVAETITKDALTLSENVEELYGCSPERKASEGGSALGRKTLKVFRALTDEESTLPFTSKAAYILSDIMSSQKTPIRFPCLLSKFRSPENLDEIVDEPELNAPLAHRLKAKFHGDTPKVCTWTCVVKKTLFVHFKTTCTFINIKLNICIHF